MNANYIEKLYDDISESGADVAVPAFCISFENGDYAVDSRVKEVTTYSKKEALEVFLFNGYLTPCVASKMWKKSLWQKIRCPEGKLFEDQYTTYKLLMLANKIVFDPEVYYYYFKRSGSIGHSSFSKRTYDLLFGIGEQYQVITEAYPETTSTMKVARTVWELVFVNMMICSKYNDKETIGQVQKHARNAFLDVVTCKYLPAVRKAEIALFCFNFSAYRFVYIKYKYKNVLDAVEEYFRTLVQRKKEDKLFELERFMAQVYEENGRCEAAEVAALCLANLYNSGGHRKITPDEYETIKKYLQKFPESMHIRAAFIIASEAIYSPSAEYKRVPDKIINKAKQWSEQYPKKIEFQEAYFGLLFSRLKYAQAQDMRNEQRRVYREMKTVAERANYSEYNESNQLMESVDILHRVFGY